MGSFQARISSAILGRIRKRRRSPAVAEPSLNNDPRKVPPAKMREVTFADFDGVARLKARSGMVADSLENWNRLWRANPALRGLVNRPAGWVLEAEGEIVGYLGNISLQCRYGDSALNAVASHGFCADPPYRALTFSLASAFYRQTSVDFFVSSTAIESSGKMALAFKCAALPQPDYDTVLLWVLRPYSFAQMLVRKLDVQPGLAAIATAIAGLAIAADKIFRKRRPRLTSRIFAVIESSIDQIDGEIAALWTDKLKESSRLYTDRSPEALRWHFGIPGDQGSVRVLRCYENEKLMGYAVVRSDKDAQDGIRRSIIADLIARHDNSAVVQALWVAAYEHAKNIGSDILEVQGFPATIREVSSAWRPYRRKYPACPYYYRATDPVLQKELNDPSAWYACPYDGDASLIRPSSSISTLRFGPAPKSVTQSEKAVALAEVQGTGVV